MSFNFGQVRKTKEINYTTSIDVLLRDVETVSKEDSSIIFIDKGFSASISSSEGYCLRVKINKRDFEQEIKVKAITASLTEQIIATILIPAGTGVYYYEKIFTPSMTANELKFELVRTDGDLFVNNSGKYGRIIEIEIVSFLSILNLLPKEVKRIGVQTAPGTLMCINGEEIHMGRSGLFEMSIDSRIFFFGIVMEENDSAHFIVDYQY